MYLLHVTCKISLISNSIFTLGTKKSLKTVLVYSYSLKTSQKKANVGLQYQQCHKDTNNPLKTQFLNIFDLFIHPDRP